MKMPKMVSQAALMNRALELMEDELRVAKVTAKDFVDSVTAAAQEALESGNKVSLLGLVTLTPSFRPSLPRRKGRDPRTGEEVMLDPRPASVRLKATPSKRLKDALPSPMAKAGKALAQEYRERQRAADERRAAREAEEAKGTRKSSGKKK
jgi:nucleoid DNA-binding protein